MAMSFHGRTDGDGHRIDLEGGAGGAGFAVKLSSIELGSLPPHFPLFSSVCGLPPRTCWQGHLHVLPPCVVAVYDWKHLLLHQFWSLPCTVEGHPIPPSRIRYPPHSTPPTQQNKVCRVAKLAYFWLWYPFSCVRACVRVYRCVTKQTVLHSSKELSGVWSSLIQARSLNSLIEARQHLLTCVGCFPFPRRHRGNNRLIYFIHV